MCRRSYEEAMKEHKEELRRQKRDETLVNIGLVVVALGWGVVALAVTALGGAR